MHPIRQYLQNRQEIKIQAGESFYHGGWYRRGHEFGGNSWFSKSLNIAAGYAALGCPEKLIADGYIPFLNHYEVVKDFSLLLINGNHIDDLQKVYGRAWGHGELARDTAANICHIHRCATGLAMNDLNDCLVIEFQNVLALGHSINDLDLIRQIKNA